MDYLDNYMVFRVNGNSMELHVMHSDIVVIPESKIGVIQMRLSVQSDQTMELL
jgi:hypothetical protein